MDRPQRGQQEPCLEFCDAGISHNIGKIGEVVDRPKALGDIRGVSYIYVLFYRFGLIDVPDEVKEKMAKR